MKKTITITAKMFGRLDADTLVDDIFEGCRVSMVEAAFALIEEEAAGNNKEDAIYNILDKIMDIDNNYVEIYDDYIVPELKDRLEKDLKVTIEWVIYAIINWKPGRIKDDVGYVLEEYLKKIYKCNSWLDLPEHVLDAVKVYDDGDYVPSEWKLHYRIEAFMKLLNTFEDYDTIESELSYLDYDLEESDMFEALCELAQNGKANNNLDLFIKIIDDTAPAANGFRRYDKEFKANIINEGTWDEEEFNTITTQFHDVDFETPYSMIIQSSIQDEVDHINKMTAINPLYRHD